LQVFFLEQEWAYCFIGGLAVLRLGSPDSGRTRISDAVEFAVKRPVLLLESEDGYGIASPAEVGPGLGLY
jgi:hypothetical protein